MYGKKPQGTAHQRNRQIILIIYVIYVDMNILTPCSIKVHHDANELIPGLSPNMRILEKFDHKVKHESNVFFTSFSKNLCKFDIYLTGCRIHCTSYLEPCRQLNIGRFKAGNWESGMGRIDA